MISLSLMLVILLNIFLQYNCILNNDYINALINKKLNTSRAQTIGPTKTFIKYYQRNKRSIRQLEEDIDNDISKSKEDTHLFDPHIADLLQFKSEKQKENPSDIKNYGNSERNNASLPEAQQKLSNPLKPILNVKPNEIEKRKISVPVYRGTASGYPAMTMFGEESPLRIVYRQMDSNEMLNDAHIDNNVAKNINDDIAKNINNDIVNHIENNIKPIDFQYTTEISMEYLTKKSDNNDKQVNTVTHPSVLAQDFAGRVNQINQIEINNKPQPSFMHVIHANNNRQHRTYNSPSIHRNIYQRMYNSPNIQLRNRYQSTYNAPQNHQNSLNRYQTQNKPPPNEFSYEIKHKLLNDYQHNNFDNFINNDNLNSIARQQQRPILHSAANSSYDNALYRQTVSHPRGQHSSYFLASPRISISSYPTVSSFNYNSQPILPKQQEPNKRHTHQTRNMNGLRNRYWRPLLPEETYNIFSKILKNNQNARILEPRLQIHSNKDRKEQNYLQSVQQNSSKDQVVASTQVKEQFGARISTKRVRNQQQNAPNLERHSLETTTTTTTTTTTMATKLTRPTRPPSQRYSHHSPSESTFYTVGATLNF